MLGARHEFCVRTLTSAQYILTASLLSTKPYFITGSAGQGAIATSDLEECKHHDQTNREPRQTLFNHPRKQGYVQATQRAQACSPCCGFMWRTYAIIFFANLRMAENVIPGPECHITCSPE